MSPNLRGGLRSDCRERKRQNFGTSVCITNEGTEILYFTNEEPRFCRLHYKRGNRDFVVYVPYGRPLSRQIDSVSTQVLKISATNSLDLNSLKFNSREIRLVVI